VVLDKTQLGTADGSQTMSVIISGSNVFVWFRVVVLCLPFLACYWIFAIEKS